MTNQLNTADLEQAYDQIARAIDSVAEDKETLFLGKLCLALANQCSSISQIEDAISMAKKNLDA